MSKKLSLSLYTVFVCVCVGYLAEFSRTMNETFNEYMDGYLNNSQKLLFSMTIFFALLLWIFKKPIYEPFIRVRLSNSLFNYIIKNAVLVSLGFSLFIFALFFVVGLVCKLPFSFDPNWINMLINIFMFSFCCYILSVCVYFASNKILLGVLSIVLLNFFLIVIIYSLSFTLTSSNLSNENTMIILRIYMMLIAVIGLPYLYKQSEKKECL